MKRKFFTTLALFFSLAITACNGGGKSEEIKWESDKTNHWHLVDGEQADKAKHTFEEDKAQSVAATCKAEGKKVEVCSVCGYVKETTLKQLDHKWDDGKVTKEATCSVPGEKTYTCSLCGETKKEEIKADHVWGTAVAVTGGEGEVDYNIFTCTVCNTAKKIEFVAKNDKATLTGSFKADSQFPDYMKLDSNGNSVEYKINSSVAGKAKIYQRGVMDFWYDSNNKNETRNYYAGKNNQDGNFKLEVNGNAVDYSWSKDITYADMLPGEAQNGYSPLGDALIGDCELIAGVNTIKYTRQESYNMLIKDFVIIIG